MADKMEERIEGQEPLIKRKRSRKTIGEEGGRKQTAIVFLVTLVLGFIFYLPKELGGWWQKLTAPEVITIEKPVGDAEDVSSVVGFKVKINDRDDAAAAVEKLVGEVAGEFGVWVEELSGSKGSWGLDETNQFTAASVIKLPILVAYYEAVDEGRLDPETLYTLVEADRLEYGTGSLQHQPAGTRYSYREIAELTANQSDNMGAELLIKFLGGYAAVQRTVNSWGLSETDLRENLTTPQEMGDLLTRLYRGELISEESRDELFANLTNTLVEDRIPAGVPTGVKVVHKYGSEAGVVNDCGIVYADTPYVICVLSQKVNAGEAEAVLPKISRVVWEWRAAAP
ncbi:TPA: hypothetical protein DEQ95_04440 [Candidatus Beckwithbacteria bacterium]|nr:MAG: hypothetical protein UY43_C0001G0095 [Candidatus Beckwithbacteria bacterium GW2011_GWC1_49_16]KKW03295.1 MAG: penicillin-binding protein [Candidatus Beckwithbacteria bacterium GW2011_GWC2_49_11]OGD50603.1 MAG: hypothetical protein A3D86_00655 [Candidatus Beckwithbacteria bacterium RIFCSPHIGHO2_02_FULL_49_13]OGD51420.1 MAG: hypothetical protein A3K56_04240 [Candidatus Beckwithbacteria bacterium RIFCSPHIGHO2_12_FULL_49_13]OGD58514.1 MAG: hypothetical protein A3J22_05075 [Candidatus Beckwi